MHVVRIALAAVMTALWFLPANSQTPQSQPEWIAALRGGGHVIVLRHGATYADQADTDPLNLKNVAQQRRLNDTGRAQARSMGEALHALRIPIGPIYTSMFQRAVDTGTLLGFGDVSPTADVTQTLTMLAPDDDPLMPNSTDNGAASHIEIPFAPETAASSTGD